jgi:DNA-binding transcriptional regulator YhcF (GntR family)
MPAEKIGAEWNEVLQKAGELGMDPAIIYAMRKTGRMVTEQNMQYLEPEELQEWEDAVVEYHSLVKSGKLQ